MDPKPRLFVSKFPIGLLIMSLTITVMMLLIYVQLASDKVRQLKLDDIAAADEEYDMYYEYIGVKLTEEVNKINEIKVIKNRIKKINNNQQIKLEYRHGTFKPSCFVIVIQIHRDTELLLLDTLLDHLKNTLGVTNSLIIFSHGSYDNEINEIIKGVHFAKHMQIFYPYSTQLFPKTFPGPDTTFCINDFECEKSMLRYEGFVQKKHFWWWQMHYVFDELRVLNNYTKTIIFLEANQYILNDMLYVHKTMEVLMTSKCPECEILVLGVKHAPDSKRYPEHNGNLAVSYWNPLTDSVGIAFNRTVWNSIKNHSYLFCEFNDYRWEMSLSHLGLNRDKGQFTVLSLVAPRIFSYHKCDGQVECSPERMVEDASFFTKSVHKELFPRSMKIVRRRRQKNISVEQEIGAWEDVRDRELCKYFVS